MSDIGGDVSGEGGEGDGVDGGGSLPLPAKVLERDSFPPLPPVARTVIVILEVVVEIVMGERVAFPPLPAGVRVMESPPLPPVAVRVELLTVVGVRVAVAVAFPPLELGALGLPPVAVMVFEGSEEVTVAEASWPVPGAAGFVSEAAWRGGVDGEGEGGGEEEFGKFGSGHFFFSDAGREVNGFVSLTCLREFRVFSC